MMQTKMITLVLVWVAVFVGVRPATAGGTVFNVTMDEYGKGTTILPTGGLIPTPTLVPAPADPLLPPGFAPTPIVYTLPFFGATVSPGDLIITEPPLRGTNQTQSDMLRFFQNLIFVI